jgi:hypothetical protein
MRMELTSSGEWAAVTFPKPGLRSNIAFLCCGRCCWPVILSAEQRRALAMLAPPGHNGATRPFLIAHGFGGATISGLVNRSFMTLTAEKIRAGGKTIDVAKVRITAAGRDALAAED